MPQFVAKLQQRLFSAFSLASFHLGCSCQTDQPLFPHNLLPADLSTTHATPLPLPADCPERTRPPHSLFNPLQGRSPPTTNMGTLSSKPSSFLKFPSFKWFLHLVSFELVKQAYLYCCPLCICMDTSDLFFIKDSCTCHLTSIPKNMLIPWLVNILLKFELWH